LKQRCGEPGRRIEPRGLIVGISFRRDETIVFQPLLAGQTIWGKYRRVEVWSEEKQETLLLLTNLMNLAATTIAAIYKQRWQIELFFKALKQNLRIKTFVGTSANAVHIQIWSALITLLLVKYLQFKSRCSWALSHLIALLRWNLFSYRDLWRWLEQLLHTPPLGPPTSNSSWIASSPTRNLPASFPRSLHLQRSARSKISTFLAVLDSNGGQTKRGHALPFTFPATAW